MKSIDITYLYNSGFTVDCEGELLIFDYWKGRSEWTGKMPVPKDPAGYRSVTVFVSHAHPDHYNREIFGWLAEREDINYVISDDVELPGRITGELGSQLTVAREGDELRVGGKCPISVQVFGSTDQGVSYCVELPGGERIFHAGDLNYWHWRDESEPSEVAEAKADFDRVMGQMETRIHGQIDVAFFPVDPRMATDYFRGAVLFSEKFRPKYLVPMHFGRRYTHPGQFYDEAGRFTSIVRFDEAARRFTLEV
jgi:L-ascorbate metabolism protein UlaG (beta-lactamase superfamily)